MLRGPDGQSLVRLDSGKKYILEPSPKFPASHEKKESLTTDLTQMEEELTLEPRRILHFSPRRTSESIRDTDESSWNQRLTLQSNFEHSSDRSINEFKCKTLTIPWNGRILTPTLTQLREFQGDLDLIEQALGSRSPKPEEKNFRIRFTWRNFIMWPTAEQLKLAKGDLNALTSICTHKLPISPSNHFFRSQAHGSPSRSSFREL